MVKIKQLFRKYSIFLIILIIPIWAIKSLFIPGFFSMHDDEQIARLFELNKLIFDGQIPPRWAPDLGFGYGFPIFNFYPPLVYYFGFFIHTLGFSFIDSTKILMALGFLLSAFFMYLWVSNRFGRLAGLISAILYTYAPYHAVDIYARGAFSEFFSFVWIPAVFWSFDKLAQIKTFKWVVICGILLTCIILTHLLVSLQLVPFLLIYIVYILFQERKSYRQMLGLFLISGLVALGLSAYFWLPAFLEKEYTLVDTILTRELASYKIHFVCIRQFWNSPWGYGASVPGCTDGLSFQIGKIHIFVAILSLTFVLRNLIKKRTKLTFPLVMLFLLGFSVFLSTKYSIFIWDAIQPFSYIQFPWRFLLFTAVFSSLLGGYIFAYCYKFLPKSLALLFIPIFYILSIFLVSNYFQPEKHLDVTDAYYTSNNDIQWRVSNMSYEYVPKQVKTKLSDFNTTQLAITKDDIPETFYTVKSGNIAVQPLKNLSWKKELIATVKEPGELQINTYAFPGWIVEINNTKVKYKTNNSLYLITVPLNVGQHKVTVTFENTPVRTISNIITAVTFLVLIAYVSLLFFYRKRLFKFIK